MLRATAARQSCRKEQAVLRRGMLVVTASPITKVYDRSCYRTT